MKAYQTDQNGIYISEVDCQPSPLEDGKFLIPEGAYIDSPPKCKENEIPKRVGNTWTKVSNFSNDIYYHKITMSSKVFKIGEPFDDSYTKLQPIKGEYFQKFTNNVWVVDTAKKRINEIKLALIEIDAKTIRPLRDNETDKLIELENQANILRAELRGLI